MSNLQSNQKVPETDADLDIFVRRLDMAKVIYGFAINRSSKCLDDLKNPEKKPSLLMVDRRLYLCTNLIKDLESKQDAMYYGPFSNDDVLLNLKKQLKLVVSDLWTKKRALTDAGYVNSLIKFLPENNRFTNMTE